MLAHASAIDSLVDSGALALPAGGGDVVERELRQVAETEAVEEELAALRGDLGPRPALGSVEDDYTDGVPYPGRHDAGGAP